MKFCPSLSFWPSKLAKKKTICLALWTQFCAPSAHALRCALAIFCCMDNSILHILFPYVYDQMFFLLEVSDAQSLGNLLTSFSRWPLAAILDFMSSTGLWLLHTLDSCFRVSTLIKKSKKPFVPNYFLQKGLSASGLSSNLKGRLSAIMHSCLCGQKISVTTI